MEVLVAARPRRGTRLLRGHPDQERTPAAAAACPGAERPRLRPLRVREPGHSAAAPGAEPAAVPPGRGHAGRSHDGSHAGSPPGIAAPPLQEAGNDRLAGPERAQHLLDVALVCNFLGQIRLSQSDHDRAAQLFTEALNAARSAQDRFTILVSLYDLALSSQAQGDLTGAAERLQEGVSQSAEARDEPSVAYYLEALAAVAVRQDNPERAVRLLAAAGALPQGTGSGWRDA